MAVQPSARPDEPSSFFRDGRAERPLIPGTIARGQLRTDRHLFAGKQGSESYDFIHAATMIGEAANFNLLMLPALAQYSLTTEADYVDEFPFPVTHEILEHGRDRYMIYCVVCHDALGTGHGKIVERGYTQPPSYHIDRLRRVAVGHFYDVITNGYGSMPEYKQQIPPRDRWAIVAYIRALQLSQHFPVGELPADMKEQMGKTDKKLAGGETAR